MTDKMPAEIWVRQSAVSILPVSDGDRYIHEFYYKRLFEAYRKNRELLRQAPHDEDCATVAYADEHPHWECDCWKSEIGEVEAP